MSEVKKDDGEKRRIARAAGLVSAMTLVSRLLGVVREQVFAALLGAGYHSDAFRIGFRIPNLLRDLFAEGALSAAFVPTYTGTAQREGREAAFRLANRVITVLGVLLGVIVLLGIAFADPLVSALAEGFDSQPGKAQLTVRLTRIMMPFLPLVSLAAVAMGMLNAQERFGVPALSPALFNVVTILWAAALWGMGLDLEQTVLGWAVGTLVGGLAQFLVQVPSLWRDGWRFRPEWTPFDPGLSRMAKLMAPATIGLAAVQVNIVVNSRFASAQEGAVSWLDCAFRLLYLPIGLFGVALGTIATTGLAKRAAQGDMDGLRLTLRQTLSLLAYLTIPATAGLMVQGVPIIRLIYQHGRFHAESTPPTAMALLLYSLGLVGYTGVKVVAPAFYALGRSRLPLIGSALAVGTNLAIVGLGHDRLGFGAIALGTALGSLVNAVFLLGSFERLVGGLRGHGLVPPMVRMALAAALMAPIVWAATWGLEAQFGTEGLLARLISCLVPVGIGGLAYAGLTRLLRVSEAQALGRLVLARLTRRGPAGTAAA
jgi:putative peptidoglycan lipid II flippase